MEGLLSIFMLKMMMVVVVVMMLLTSFIGDAIADAVLPNSHLHLRGYCCSFVFMNVLF